MRPWIFVFANNQLCRHLFHINHYCLCVCLQAAGCSSVTCSWTQQKPSAGRANNEEPSSMLIRCRATTMANKSWLVNLTIDERDAALFKGVHLHIIRSIMILYIKLHSEKENYLLSKLRILRWDCCHLTLLKTIFLNKDCSVRFQRFFSSPAVRGVPYKDPSRCLMIPKYICLPQTCLLLHKVYKDSYTYGYQKYKCCYLWMYIKLRQDTNIAMATRNLFAAT